MDGDVLAKIKKALALASHEGTGEQEAKAALRLVFLGSILGLQLMMSVLYSVASKLMALHRCETTFFSEIIGSLGRLTPHPQCHPS